MTRSIFPVGKGIAPFVRECRTISVEHARAMPYAKIRFKDFEDSKGKVMFWPPSRMDIHRIIHAAESVKSPAREFPVILDIGTGTGLLAFLMAQTGRAVVIGIDPHRPFMETPAYTHENLCYYHAGVEWAVKNLSGEIDLAVWSWPLTTLDPLEKLRTLSPRGAMIIFDVDDCRVGIETTDAILYKYQVNYDKFEGFKKALFWNGINYRVIKGGQSIGSFFPKYNSFALFVNEGVDVEIPEESGVREYPWIKEAKTTFPNFPVPGKVVPMNEHSVLCPDIDWY